jgi:hypothetical protein
MKEKSFTVLKYIVYINRILSVTYKAWAKLLALNFVFVNKNGKIT